MDSGPYALLRVNGPDQWTYDDTVTAFASGKGRFCYYVQAIETGNPVLDAVSESNTACAVQEEAVWIPNAFIIGGHNPVFLPVLAYVDVTTYELAIYNRWGQLIWTTNDPYKPWDGQVDGTYVPQGVYAYYCAFNNGAGKRIERRGTVTCLWGRE
ncbi:MAG: gliding motility-associated C-terminal domain-containing protein [Flavobacteriales bacterium]